MKNKYLLVGLMTLTMAASAVGCGKVINKIDKMSLNDGWVCELEYDEDYIKGSEILKGEWASLDSDKTINVYGDETLYIDGDGFGNYDIYKMEISDDEFDIYKGEKILKIECNAGEMQFNCEFSYNEGENFLYYGTETYSRQ